MSKNKDFVYVSSNNIDINKVKTIYKSKGYIINVTSSFEDKMPLKEILYKSISIQII